MKNHATSKLSPTQKAISEKYPHKSAKTINHIDNEIRKSIAHSDDPQKITEYIETAIPKKKNDKHRYRQNISSIKNTYIQKNNHWLFQENLFCFLALHISVISMFIEILKRYNEHTLFGTKYATLAIYGVFTVIFFFVDYGYKHYEHAKENSNSQNYVKLFERFDSFLKILNRFSPCLIVIGTLLFYVLLCLLPCVNKLTTCILVITALFPMLSFVFTINKL